MNSRMMHGLRELTCFLAVGMILGVLGTTVAVAAEIWADAFDEWCDPDPGPGDADKCSTGTPPNEDAFWYYYPEDPLDACSGGGDWAKHQLKQEHVEDGEGYSVKVAQDILLVRHAHDLAHEILANPDNALGKTAVNGSGEILDSSDPDYVDPATITTVLKGRHQFYTLGGSSGNNVFYVEWCGGDDRAPVNWTMFNCFTQYHGYPGPPDDENEKGKWRSPVLKTTDGTVHASFALGVFALIDPYPCDLAAGRYSTEYTPVAFDGLNWVSLEGLPNTVDGWNRFEYFIGTDYIEIRMKPGGGSWAKTRIQRQYVGPFNKVAMGTPQGVSHDPPRCERAEWDNSKACVGGLNNGDPCTAAEDCPPSIGTCVSDACFGGSNHGAACSTDDDCPDYEECWWIPKSYVYGKTVNAVTYEELHLEDGVFTGPDAEGACCLGDGGCIQASDESECTGLGGIYAGNFTYCASTVCTGACCPRALMDSCEDIGFNECDGHFQGVGTTCDSVECPCPDPFADVDGDGDVDHDDFGVFQACFTGFGGDVTVECACLDWDENGNIDGDDFAAFEACASGPGVPLDAACDD